MDPVVDQSLQQVEVERFRRFVAVLELGERFPKPKRRDPLPDMTSLWRAAAERGNAVR